MLRTSSVMILILTVLSTTVFCADVTMKYQSKGKRDPFVPLVGPESSHVSGLAEIVSIDDVHLEGIAVGARGSMTAILNGDIVKEGDAPGQIIIKKITNNTVYLSLSGKDYELHLQEERGKK